MKLKAFGLAASALLLAGCELANVIADATPQINSTNVEPAGNASTPNEATEYAFTYMGPGVHQICPAGRLRTYRRGMAMLTADFSTAAWDGAASAYLVVSKYRVNTRAGDWVDNNTSGQIDLAEIGSFSQETVIEFDANTAQNFATPDPSAPGFWDGLREGFAKATDDCPFGVHPERMQDERRPIEVISFDCTTPSTGRMICTSELNIDRGFMYQYKWGLQHPEHGFIESESGLDSYFYVAL